MSRRRPKPIAPILWSVGAVLVTAVAVMDAALHLWAWLAIAVVSTAVSWAWLVPASVRTYRARMRRWRVCTDALARLNEILSRSER